MLFAPIQTTLNIFSFCTHAWEGAYFVSVGGQIWYQKMLQKGPFVGMYGRDEKNHRTCPGPFSTLWSKAEQATQDFDLQLAHVCSCPSPAAGTLQAFCSITEVTASCLAPFPSSNVPVLAEVSVLWQPHLGHHWQCIKYHHSRTQQQGGQNEHIYLSETRLCEIVPGCWHF